MYVKQQDYYTKNNHSKYVVKTAYFRYGKQSISSTFTLTVTYL